MNSEKEYQCSENWRGLWKLLWAVCFSSCSGQTHSIQMEKYNNIVTLFPYVVVQKKNHYNNKVHNTLWGCKGLHIMLHWLMNPPKENTKEKSLLSRKHIATFFKFAKDHILQTGTMLSGRQDKYGTLWYWWEIRILYSNKRILIPSVKHGIVWNHWSLRNPMACKWSGSSRFWFGPVNSKELQFSQPWVECEWCSTTVLLCIHV